MMFKLIVALACVLAGSTVAAADAPPSALRRSLLTRRAGKPTDGALLDPSPNGGCDCVGDSCQCCEHISSKKIVKFDDTVCLNATYIASAVEIDLDVTLNGKEVYEKSVGLSDLTKICFGIPLISKLASGCLEFNDLIINTTYVGAEVDFVVEALDHKILSVDLGHIHFKP